VSLPFRGILPDIPAVVLAPMEGVTDAPIRALFSEIGGFSYCVSEFVRVSQDIIPQKTFLGHIPEGKNQFTTHTGLPVQVQLLGGNPERLAKSALNAVQIGAWGIDLNFGCPAPTVNRHDGGATLLKYPDRIETIVRTIRNTLPVNIPVSAKMRLGWDDPNSIVENALRAEAGGASWITIHARTKLQGYQPPAFWEYIRKAKDQLRIPVVANGDIWTLEDFKRCREITGAKHFMLGRSAMANPFLAFLLRKELGLESKNIPEYFWSALIPWFIRFEELSRQYQGAKPNPTAIAARMKQWLRMISHRTPAPGFSELKLVEKPELMLEAIRSHFTKADY